MMVAESSALDSLRDLESRLEAELKTLRRRRGGLPGPPASGGLLSAALRLRTRGTVVAHAGLVHATATAPTGGDSAEERDVGERAALALRREAEALLGSIRERF